MKLDILGIGVNYPHNLKKHGSETIYYGAIGGGMTYIFTPTSIGTVCKVKCSCGEEFCFREL